MSIMENGEEIENIILSDYDTEEEMHALFKEKGFEQLSAEEIKLKAEVKEERESAERDQAAEKRNQQKSSRMAEMRAEEEMKAKREMRKPEEVPEF